MEIPLIMSANQILSQEEQSQILQLLKSRLEKNKYSCEAIEWISVKAKLENWEGLFLLTSVLKRFLFITMVRNLIIQQGVFALY